MSNGLPKIIAIVGPTASGKSDLAISLAKEFGGEVISADSRQFYKGTEIGAGTVRGIPLRPSGYEGLAELSSARGANAVVAEGVRHYMIGFLQPDQAFTASEFKDAALEVIGEITRRGNVPILVGGTGLFVSALVENFQIPQVAPDEDFRSRMGERGIEELFAELEEKDPDYASRIPPNNRRYVTRALEVMNATGKKVSELQVKGESLVDALVIAFVPDREVLKERIDKRVDAMMAEGLVEETKRLVLASKDGASVLTGIGHRQIGMHLRGELSLEEAVELVKKESKKYAKRQVTWIRRMADAKVVASGEEARGLAKSFLA